MKPKILLKYELTDIDTKTFVVIEAKVTKLFAGIKMKLKPIGDNAAAKVSAKMPAFWIASFQADKIVVTLKIGSDFEERKPGALVVV